MLVGVGSLLQMHALAICSGDAGCPGRRCPVAGVAAEPEGAEALDVLVELDCALEDEERVLEVDECELEDGCVTVTSSVLKRDGKLMY